MSDDLKKEVIEIAKKESEQFATIAVSKKMNIVYIMLLTILGLLLAFIITNSNRTILMSDFISTQKELNKTFVKEIKEINKKTQDNKDSYNEKLNKISDNQIITFWELKKIDPNFDPFELRSGKLKN